MRRASWLVLAFAYIFIYLPVAVLVLFSFQESRVPVPPFDGPTFDWYVKILGDRRVLEAAVNSLLVGVLSSLVATSAGFLAASGFARHRILGGRLLETVIVVPITVSYLVIGLGLLITLNALGFSKSLLGVGIGHVVINLPLCFMIALAQLGPAEARLEAAARDLGAREWQVMARITLPLSAPGLFAAFFLAFTLSWDEFVIAFLLTSFDITLPVVIWSKLRTGLNPETNAIGALVFLVSLVTATLVEFAISRRRGSRA